nr:hypothetical protein [Tanacetum cinerariifolium]
MSNSKDSIVTYTEVSSPFEGLSDIGSPGVEGQPMMPEDPYEYVVADFQAPHSPNYVPGLEEPEQAPPLPEFVPEPEDPKEDLEDDPTDYPINGGDDDNESSDDDEDYDDEDEEEEHPTPTDSIPPSPVHPSPPLPVSFPPLPASPIYPLGYTAAMIRLRAETPSTSHPPPPIVLPHTREYVAMLRATAPSIYIFAPRSETPPLLPIPLPTSSPLLLLPFTSHRSDVPEVTLPPWKRLCIALGLKFEVGESSSAPTARPTRGFRADYGFVATLDDEIIRDPERYVGYGITDTWDEMLVGMPGAPATDETKLGRRMTNFVTTVRQYTDEIYTEARLSRQSWVQSMDASDTTRVEVASLRTTVLAQQSKIAGLRAADLTRQTQLAEKMALKRTTRSTPATIITITTTSVTDAQLKALIDQGVANALAARDADRSRNGKDSHDSGMGARRQAPPAYECTYQDFMKCKTLYFKGTEGVVDLTQWFERMETVFFGPDVAYAMTWTNLKKKMTDKYCPRVEIKKLKELALMCARMFPEESDKTERYIGRLPDMIHESVMESKPKTMQDLIEFTTELMDKKISTFAE